MSETNMWPLCQENLRPPGSSSRDTVSQKSLPGGKQSDSSVGEGESRRSALTPLHGSQPSMGLGLFSKSGNHKKSQTSSLSSVKEPGFYIYQDEIEDEDVENDQVFMSPPPHGGNISLAGSSPGSAQRVPNASFFDRTHDFERMALSDVSAATTGYCSFLDFEEENKENVSPMAMALQVASSGRRQMAGVLAESQTIPFIPLDIQEMILDQDEREQNDEILQEMMLEQGLSHTAQDGDQMRRWSL